MGKIRKLPQELASQIAAGEVIERPASAVKELIENALDAGASRIDIQVEDGGKQLIKVTDNGYGMSREDVAMCVEPHATSKIQDSEGLSKITTLGFRGEALASIGAVSELTVSSRCRGSTTGWQVKVTFGHSTQPKVHGMPEGTEIKIERLFQRIPARLKFLKRKQTETGHIMMKVKTAAVLYPEVRFSLASDGRTVFRSRQPVRDAERLWPLLGDDLARRLVPLRAMDMDINVNGYITLPSDARNNGRAFYFFMNGRPITDRLLWKAVSEAGRGFFMKGTYPAGAIFMEMPPEMVDVNVHPAKNEVRFHDSNRVFRLVYQAIRRALDTSDEKDITTGHTQPNMGNEENAEKPAESYRPAMQQRMEVMEKPEPPGHISTSGICGQPSYAGNTTLSHKPFSSIPRHENIAGDSCVNTIFSTLEITGQFANTYIIACDSLHLFIIDQHAAHEAIIFKRLMREITGKKTTASQPLMFPEILECSLEDMEKLDDIRPWLERMGIIAETFGDSEIAIKAVPDFIAAGEHASREARAVIAGLLKSPVKGYEAAVHDIIASFACRLAIKAGQKLEQDEMRSLLEEMDEEMVSRCPHGRPVFRSFSTDNMEKMFGRRK